MLSQVIKVIGASLVLATFTFIASPTLRTHLFGPTLLDQFAPHDLLGQLAQNTQIAASAQAITTTFYFPTVGGDTLEGGLESSRRGPDGKNLVRTLQDYRTGKSPYITLASDPSRYGQEFILPSVTYTEYDPTTGTYSTYTLKNVRAVVHDTGSAFRGRPDKIDIAASQAPNSEIAKELNRKPHSGLHGVGYVPNNEEASIEYDQGTIIIEEDPIVSPPHEDTTNPNPDDCAPTEPTCEDKPTETCTPEKQAAGECTPPSGNTGNTGGGNNSGGGSGIGNLACGGAPWCSIPRYCYKYGGSPGPKGIYPAVKTCNSGFQWIDKKKGTFRAVADCGKTVASAQVKCDATYAIGGPLYACLWQACAKGRNAIWDMDTKLCGCDDGGTGAGAPSQNTTDPADEPIGDLPPDEQDQPIGDIPADEEGETDGPADGPLEGDVEADFEPGGETTEDPESGFGTGQDIDNGDVADGPLEGDVEADFEPDGETPDTDSSDSDGGFGTGQDIDNGGAADGPLEGNVDGGFEPGGGTNTGTGAIPTGANAPGKANGAIVTSPTTTQGPFKSSQAVFSTPEGVGVTPTRVAIDTDGIGEPPFYDSTRQSQTSLPGLNANTQAYVVVPIGSSIPLNTTVKITNHTTGKEIFGIVGDRGPTGNGYGELSLYAAQQLGAWETGLGNAAYQHTITYTFYTK